MNRNRKRRHSRRRLLGERCELRYCLSGVAFSTHDIIASDAYSPWCVYAADVDGDGDVDLLSASHDDKIAWYENADGQGHFEPQHVITTAADGANSVYAADLDGDGDLDVLSASRWDDKIAWYENTDGQGSFGPQQVITTATDYPRSVSAGDLDGDGDLDVLSASFEDGKIAWYENTDGQGTFGPQHVITAAANSAYFVSAGDLDGDGDLDVISGSLGKLAWYENTDGQGTFGPQQVIRSTASGAYMAEASDVDGDGDLDLVSASAGTTIAWYENMDGQGTFGPQHVISPAVLLGSVHAADLDSDGDLDVVSASWMGDAKVAWYENTDGRGTYGQQQVITTTADGAQSVSAGDLDGDGDLDVVSASFLDDKIAWYENTDGQGGFGPQQVIATAADSANSVHAADLDGDGDLDLLSATGADVQTGTQIAWNTITWYENTDGQGRFGPQQVISTAVDGASSVYAGDLDGDGDLDVLSASRDDGKIAWYENTNGLGKFGPQQVITSGADGANSVYAGDLDSDGDLDVLSASYVYGDHKIAWYENTNGLGSFGPQQVITTTAVGVDSVYAGDVDGDGDLDVLSASSDDNKIAWYENADGRGNFGPQQVITIEAKWASSVYAGDFDGDGDLDVLAGSLEKIAWYENTDGQGGSFLPRPLMTTEVNTNYYVCAGDVDGDGDLDVLALFRGGQDGRLTWYENTDGLGTFGPQQVITTAANTGMSVVVGDVDGDSDLDVLSGSIGKLAWYENLLPHPGDANGDGRFDSNDLVQVFQAGEYEDTIEDNSTWEEGDWNGDGDCDSNDLVLAFQTGLYEIKSQAVGNQLAAAVDRLFAQDQLDCPPLGIRLRRCPLY